jgi:hypothetical protein
VVPAQVYYLDLRGVADEQTLLAAASSQWAIKETSPARVSRSKDKAMMMMMIMIMIMGEDDGSESGDHDHDGEV